MSRTIGALVAGLALSTFVASAHAEVPTVTDFAACNMKAAEEAASDVASASPRTDGAPRAGTLPPDARLKPPAPPASVLRDPTGTTLSSDKDPQINGMAADRANDRVYVAAYRACMRQKGF